MKTRIAPLCRAALGASLLLTIGLSASPAFAKKSTDKLSVAVLAVNYNSPSVLEMANTAMDECKKRGWTCELHDGKGDQVATNNAAMNFINRKFDALINIASDNNQMMGVVKAANEAKIPFVSAFSGDVPGITADISASGFVDGAITGSALKSALNNKGHIVKFNWTVLPVLRDRDNGFKAVMIDAKKDIKVTEIEIKVPGQVEDAYNQMTNLLASNKDITGVWVGWDELAPSVVRAIERANMKGKIKVVGIDGTQPVYDMMRKGDSPYLLSVAYSKKSAAAKTIQVVGDVMDGKASTFRAQFTRTCIVSKEVVPAPGKDPDFTTCTPFSSELGLR